MTAAGQAIVLADGFAENHPTGVEHARNDSSVLIGNEVGVDGRAVHHRHSGDADIVLDGDAFAFELAAAGALDSAFPIPGVVGILRRARTDQIAARILDGQHRCRERIDQIEIVDHTGHELGVHREFLIVQPVVELAGGGAQFFQRRSRNRWFA